MSVLIAFDIGIRNKTAENCSDYIIAPYVPVKEEGKKKSGTATKKFSKE